MCDTVEDICYEAHRLGKREVLLEHIPRLHQKLGNIPLNELYQKAYEDVLRGSVAL